MKTKELNMEELLRALSPDFDDEISQLGREYNAALDKAIDEMEAEGKGHQPVYTELDIVEKVGSMELAERVFLEVSHIVNPFNATKEQWDTAIERVILSERPIATLAA